MKTLTFSQEPTFAELWDACVHLIYNDAEPLARDIENLFQKLGVSKDSEIVDVAAGSGFPALALVKDGYRVTCTDGAADEVALFNRKAKEYNLTVSCDQVLWSSLPNRFKENSLDFLFCRGNSFIYAAGGWNEMRTVDSKESLKKFKETLTIFYTLLKPGGWLYIDKFRDSETTSRELVAQIKVANGAPENLIFWRERFPEKKVRQASMIRETAVGEKKLPNITYDLLGPELESMMADIGFINTQKIQLPSEHHFDVWIAQKQNATP